MGKRKNQNISESIPMYESLVSIVKNNRFQIIALFILCIIVYINGINNEFVSDDRAGILFSPYNGDIEYAFKVGNANFFYYLIRIVEYWIGGLNPFIYRLGNILFHSLSSILVFLIFTRIVNKKTGFLISAIFAVHPLLVEGVTWIGGSAYSNGAFFFLASFLFYIEGTKLNNLKFKALSLLLFAISIFTSEKLLFTSLMFILYSFLYEKSYGYKKYLFPSLYLIPSLVLGIVLISMIPERISDIENAYYGQAQVSNVFLQFIIAISEYLKLIFWPAGLTLYHSELSFSNSELTFRTILVIGIIIFCFIAFIKSKVSENYKFFAFWFSFFIVALLPTLLPFGLSWVVAERYVYLGALGIFAIVGFVAGKLLEKDGLNVFVYTVFAVAILALSIRTIVRNQDWKNEDTLWIATAKTSPSSPNTHNNMGDVYSRRGDFDNAIKEFTWAIEINPRYADAYHNRGTAFLSKGETDSAVKDFETALNINPNLWQSAQNLAYIYFENEEYEKSSQFLEYAFSKNQSINIAYNLALSYSKIGKTEEARSILIQILASDPNNQTVISLLSDIGY